jgi:hypothetical protein
VDSSVHSVFTWYAATLALLVGMLASLEWGRRLGQRRLAREGTDECERLGTINGAVFALLGLLIAFTFSGATNRFEERHVLVVDEANAIGTAWLRLDLLGTEPRAQLQSLFREYLDARLAAYERLPDFDAARLELDHASQVQAKIWSLAVSACEARAENYVAVLLLPALNEMFDVATKRTAIGTRHTPTAVFALLFCAALGCAVLAGFSTAASRERSLLHSIGFATLIAAAVYVTIDLEFPRMGLIRVDHADAVLLDVRAGMK